jgi:hypothetical protein
MWAAKAGYGGCGTAVLWPEIAPGGFPRQKPSTIKVGDSVEGSYTKEKGLSSFSLACLIWGHIV